MKILVTIKELAEKQKVLEESLKRMKMLLSKAPHRINRLENKWL